MKNKKSQFFIIAALIGVMIIFSFFGLVVYKKIPKYEKIYDLGKNFKFEVIETIAKGKIKEFGGEQVLIDYLDNITYEYLKYGLTEDPNIEIIYIFGNKSSLAVYNFGNNDLYVFNGIDWEEVKGGRKNISNTLSLVEIKTTIMQDYSKYQGSLLHIRKFFSGLNLDKITINISNTIYNFELEDEDNFYIILKSRKINETFVHIEK